MVDGLIITIPNPRRILLVAGFRGVAVVHIYSGVGGRAERRNFDPGDYLAGRGVVLFNFVRQFGFAIAGGKDNVVTGVQPDMPAVCERFELDVCRADEDGKIGERRFAFRRLVDLLVIECNFLAVVPGAFAVRKPTRLR